MWNEFNIVLNFCTYTKTPLLIQKKQAAFAVFIIQNEETKQGMLCHGLGMFTMSPSG